MHEKTGWLRRTADRIMQWGPLAVLLGATVAVMPVLARQASIMGEVQAHVSTVLVPEEDSESETLLPPITWDFVMTPEEQACKQAIAEDIISADAVYEFPTPLSWPVLPYPEINCSRIKDIAEELYSEYPLLSVATNGQIKQAISCFGRYHLSSDGANPTADVIDAEMVAVDKAAETLATEAESDLDALDDDDDSWMHLHYTLKHGDDYLYATLAAIRVARGCTYSDGWGDTPHANDIYGALVEGESKCYGTSCAVKAVLDRRGIPAFVASGNLGESKGRHAVTVLWVEGGWHVIDLTSLNRQTIPETLGWHSSSVPVPSRGWQLAYQTIMTHDLFGSLGQIVTPLDEYEEAHKFVMDSQYAELMDAYESRVEPIRSQFVGPMRTMRKI